MDDCVVISSDDEAVEAIAKVSNTEPTSSTLQLYSVVEFPPFGDAWVVGTVRPHFYKLRLPWGIAFAPKEALREPSQTVVCQYPPIGRGAVTLTKADLLRLQPGMYLNDNIVDFYLRFFREEMQTKLAASTSLAGVTREGSVVEDRKDDTGKSTNSTYCFSSHFYAHLSRSDPVAMLNWTKAVDIFEKDFLFVPINQSLHWSLLIICNPGCTPLKPKPNPRPPRSPSPDPDLEIVPPPPPNVEQFHVVVPDGVKSGETIHVNVPDKSGMIKVQCVVPPGLNEGDSFNMELDLKLMNLIKSGQKSEQKAEQKAEQKTERKQEQEDQGLVDQEKEEVEEKDEEKENKVKQEKKIQLEGGGGMVQEAEGGGETTEMTEQKQEKGGEQNQEQEHEKGKGEEHQQNQGQECQQEQEQEQEQQQEREEQQDQGQQKQQEGKQKQEQQEQQVQQEQQEHKTDGEHATEDSQIRNGENGAEQSASGKPKDVRKEKKGEMGAEGDVEALRLRPCMILLDSLKMHNLSSLGKQLRAFLKVAWNARERQKQEQRETEGGDRGGSGPPPSPKRAFTGKTFPAFSVQVPQQPNGWDCGVYMLLYATKFMQDPPKVDSRFVYNKGRRSICNDEWFSADEADEMRNKVEGTILRLMQEQKHEQWREQGQRRRGGGGGGGELLSAVPSDAVPSDAGVSAISLVPVTIPSAMPSAVPSGAGAGAGVSRRRKARGREDEEGHGRCSAKVPRLQSIRSGRGEGGAGGAVPHQSIIDCTTPGTTLGNGSSVSNRHVNSSSSIDCTILGTRNSNVNSSNSIDCTQSVRNDIGVSGSSTSINHSSTTQNGSNSIDCSQSVPNEIGVSGSTSSNHASTPKSSKRKRELEADHAQESQELEGNNRMPVLVPGSLSLVEIISPAAVAPALAPTSTPTVPAPASAVPIPAPAPTPTPAAWGGGMLLDN